jgi:hypothetical protein
MRVRVNSVNSFRHREAFGINYARGKSIVSSGATLGLIFSQDFFLCDEK